MFMVKIVLVRVCTKCGKTKPLTAYKKNPRYAAGRLRQCRECDARYQRSYMAANPSYYKKEYKRRKDYVAKWRDKNRDRYNANLRLWRKSTENRLRVDAMVYLGAECRVCHNSDFRVLEIDHVNGGGSAERRTTNRCTMYRKILAGADGYQLLCANCHRIKTHFSRQ